MYKLVKIWLLMFLGVWQSKREQLNKGKWHKVMLKNQAQLRVKLVNFSKIIQT